MIDAKADVNAKRCDYDWRGCGSTTSAFEMALPAAFGDVKLLELFLAGGADPNTKSVRDRHSMRTDGRSEHYVLHKAVKAGDLEIARALLDAGADIDAVASDIFDNERGFNQNTQETALHIACARQDLAMCALLLARGANVNAVRKLLEQESSGVESTTEDPRDPDFVSSVVCIPVQETSLHIAFQQQNPHLVTMLVCAGADVTHSRRRGDVSFMPEELSGDDTEVKKALRAEWTPETHHLFPPEVRDVVKVGLLVAQRQQWPLPDSVLFRAFAMAVGRPALVEDAASGSVGNS